MLTNQILELAGEVRRLLGAGATLAADDSALRRHEREFRKLGEKVPALVVIADAVRDVHAAGPGDVTPALLHLLVLVRQTAAAFAGPPSCPQPEPLPDSGPWFNVTPTRDVPRLLDELQSRTMHSALEAAAEKGTVHDLRLFDAVLRARAGDARRADLIFESVLPAYGPAVLPLLLHPAADEPPLDAANRILALCKIDPAAGLEALTRHDAELGALLGRTLLGT